jgi:uncharacterized repeat protein (TIGR01451 family)
MRFLLGLAALAVTVAALAAVASPVAAVPPVSPVSEYQPTINPEWRGKTNAVTVHPTNSQIAFVATDSGGLFKTTDGGDNWSFVSSFTPNAMSDVRYFPDNANVIIATADEDSGTVNGGGIWRSTDGGATWQKPATSDSPNVGCTAPRHALGIGITTGGVAYVGTPCGVATTTNFGATWTHTDPPGAGLQVNDAVAQPGGIADICTNAGHYRTTNFGGLWTGPTAGSPACNSIDASPFENNVVFASSGGGILWEADPNGSGGFTWTQLFAPSPGNRPPFVRTHPATDGDATHYDLFFGDGVSTYRQHCANSGGPGLRCPVTAEAGGQCSNNTDDDGDQIVNEGCPAIGPAETTGRKDSDPQCNDNVDEDADGGDGAGPAGTNDGCPIMLPYATEHHHWFDNFDIGFDTSSPNGCPLYVVGDGSIGRSTDCGVTFPSDADGLDAFQMYEVTGTVHPGHTDLYYGTQDNLIWGSPDGGVTWPNKIFYEGFYLQTPRFLAGDDYEVTGVTCGPCSNFRVGEHLTGNIGWDEPPGQGGNPFLIEPGRYAQVSNGRLYITEPETGADCSNNTDDDADNAINDGCPAVGGAETGTQCHNNTDDDGGDGGAVNDGCSSFFSVESGAECTNGTDDDGDDATLAVNDGCPAVGPDTDGDGNPDPETPAQCQNTADNDADGTVNDGCPKVGVFARTGPALPALSDNRLDIVGPPSAPTIYIYTNTGPQRIEAIGNGAAVITNPGNAGLNSIGNYCRVFICHRAVGVDPNNPQRLVAADVGTSQMKVSNDGGATWQVDLELTAAVTGNGQWKFQFRGETQAHVIQFDPANGNRILVGTEDNGIIASLNGGADWFKVQTSEKIPAITTFFFDEVQDDIYVSSFGRGLWKLNFPQTDLSITKSDYPDPVMAGEELFYTVSVTNNGPNPATVEVLDNLPPQVQYIGTDLLPPNGCVEFTTDQLRCNIGVLQNGDTISFTIKVRVKSNASVASPSGSTTIINTAIVQSTDTVDPSTADNTAQTATFAEELSDLRVTKICKPDDPLAAGQTGTCTIYVDNLGPSDARNVVMEDSILSDGTFAIGTVTPSQGTCDPPTPANIVHCDLGNLVAASTSASGRATVTIDVTATEAMDINDVANAVSDTPDPDTANNQAQESLSIYAVSDMGLTKTASAASVVAGTNLIYTLTVTNNGPSTAQNVVIDDTLSSSVEVVSVIGSNSATCNAGVPGDPFLPTRCSYGTLAPAASRTMSVTVKVKPDVLGIIHNDARAFSDTFDDNALNNLATVATTVTAQADLSITKSATPNPVVAGTPLSYQITVTNNGPSVAHNVSVTDPLPAALTLTGTSITLPGLCGLQVNTNTVSCQVAGMAPGQTATIFIYTGVSPSASNASVLSNTASVSSETTDPAAGNNSANVLTTVNARADLAITLTSDKNVYKPSTVIHYQITVVNNGPSDAQSVMTSQELPPAKTGYYVSNDGGCPAPVGTTFVCSLGTVPAGGMRTYQLNFYIRGNKRTISQTANVSSSTTDPVAVNNSSTRNVTVK